MGFVLRLCRRRLISCMSISDSRLAGKLPRKQLRARHVGVGSPETSSGTYDAFYARKRALGYVESRKDLPTRCGPTAASTPKTSG
jgi:hypothetical protein